MNDRYTQILLILPVAAALIFQGWKALDFKSEFWMPGAGLLMLFLLLTGLARWEKLGGSPGVELAIGMMGLVGWWITSFAFSFGLTALRLFLFPLSRCAHQHCVPNRLESFLFYSISRCLTQIRTEIGATKSCDLRH